MDTLSPEQRHAAMSHNRSRDTAPELRIRSALHKIGFRFRKNDRRLSGTPDLVFPRYKAALFVNGCFWHAHQNCAKFRLPSSNTEYWKKKLARNRERDAADAEKLAADGWRVGIVWECSITGRNRAQKIQNVSEAVALWLEEEFSEPFVEF
ncbi:MAG: very short patch repair endonuclease [Treponemataceae bacterium]|nr:very short patch repair endonuclease [Treponemataceae bacterium]